MPSLAAHLREPDAHDRLPFHPSCPICRQTRLTGHMPADALVSPRTQALVAAGVLAMSTAGPAAAALAAEQDQQQDGTASVGQTGASDPADNPDFDPGGDGTDLPQTAPPVPQTQAPADPGNDDTAPVDQPSATNPDDPVVDSGDGSDTTATSTQPTQPPSDSPSPSTTATATTTTPAAPSETTTPAPSPPASATPTTAPSAPAAPAPRAVSRASHSSSARHRSHHPSTTTPTATSPTYSPPAAVTPVAETTTAAPVTTVQAGAGGRHAKPGDRTHSVLPGESLWTIATDLLGSDASTAGVAREVHRLWQLNKERIGTGDPDLLMIGTKLELR
jgi:hypothetical protein